MADKPKQQSLFSVSEQRTFTPKGPRTQPKLDIDKSFLQRWKSDIHHYQTRIVDEQHLQQTSLFGEQGAKQISLFGSDAPAVDKGDKKDDPLKQQTSSGELVETIDPFSLDLHNFFFFQWPADRHPDSACLYFVMDTCVPLLLYVGETCQANQRWKGVHGCKNYVLNYQSLHFTHHIPTAINTGFWWDAPPDTRPRQQLEAALIYRWRSPFNKENWKFWGTPFVQKKV